LHRQSDPNFDRDFKRRKILNDSDRRMRDFLSAIKAYGGRCAVCGYDDPIGLTLHHPVSPPKEERRKRKECYATLRQKNYKPARIILCGTCHMAHHRMEHFVWQEIFPDAWRALHE
jgi:hypothetical protein